MKKLIKRSTLIASISLAFTLLLASCVMDKTFKWEQVKLEQAQMQLKVGETKALVLQGVPQSFTVTYTSNNPKVATCQKENVTAISKGATNINVKVVCPKGYKKELTCHIEVAE